MALLLAGLDFGDKGFVLLPGLQGTPSSTSQTTKRTEPPDSLRKSAWFGAAKLISQAIPGSSGGGTLRVRPCAGGCLEDCSCGEHNHLSERHRSEMEKKSVDGFRQSNQCIPTLHKFDAA